HAIASYGRGSGYECGVPRNRYDAPEVVVGHAFFQSEFGAFCPPGARYPATAVGRPGIATARNHVEGSVGRSRVRIANDDWLTQFRLQDGGVAASTPNQILFSP